jgi:hypothetical protein
LPFRNFAPISVSKRNVSGPIWRSCATPALLGLFSLVTLWAHDLAADAPLVPATAAWYPKRHCTFSDAIAAVRREIWHHQVSFMSRCHRDTISIPRQLWHRAANALAYAA